MTVGRVLIIAGSDPGGGAGIQGDVKTVTALGGYAMAAITALTAQNTEGVFGILDVPEDFIARQIRLVLEDIGADAIKTGMLHKASVIETVADVLTDYPDIPLVLDPVMVAKGGAPLLDTAAVDVLKKRLFPRATLITPNLPEAEALLKSRVADMKTAARKLLEFGSKAVFLKGGHGEGDTVTDVLEENGISTQFSSHRIATPHTHGTGCALASAIATSIAQGMGLQKAVKRAHAYVHEAIKTAPGLGKGQGPINHLI